MQKRFTDIFVQRPVLSVVISLLIFFIGLRAIFSLPVREFPKVENTVISVTTAYPGASADLVEGFITGPVERAVASAEGVDYLTSSSVDGVSTVSAYIRLGFDPGRAFTDIMSKTSQVKNQLPKASQDSVISKSTGSATALMYISFNSSEMSGEQITDYLSRVVQPKMETVPGVASAALLGSQRYAMRIWLDSQRMAALKISPNEVLSALSSNNFQAAAGATKGAFVAFPIDASTGLTSQKEFEGLIIKQTENVSVHLRDVAKVELGSENYDSSVIFNGKRAVFMAISAAPTANPLTVISAVKDKLPEISKRFPPALHEKVVYDATKYIKSSIYEVIKTILEAGLIVIVVIFLFLGSMRTMIVPIVTIPLSLVGVFSIMLLLGYSINLLTLLALVLAIGMVVDDAIVVVENVYRHIEEGKKPYDAALQGAREIAFPVISMTLTLAAVYTPIGLLSGVTGALFKEFAFTLASSVVLSGVIALTLSPMMCSRLLVAEIGQNAFVKKVDSFFLKLKNNYASALESVIKNTRVLLVFSFFVLISCFFLFTYSQSEMAPEEDQGVLFVMATGQQTATLDYVERFTHTFGPIYNAFPSLEDYFIINGMNGTNGAMSGFIMKPWEERTMSQKSVNKSLQAALNKVAGLRVQVFPLPSLPTGGGGLPIDFELTSTRSFEDLYPLTQKILQEARSSGKFLFIDTDLSFNKHTLQLNIDRSKAASMGIRMSDLAQGLAGALAGGYVNYFSMSGKSYQVIPQLIRDLRGDAADIQHIQLKTAMGKMVPLSAFAHISWENKPNARTHFQQLNAVGIQGLMAPGQTIGDALAYLKTVADKYLPSDVSYDYAGASRQFMQEGNALLYAFAFSILVIFLVLAAQFESFKDPLVVMTSVPMAICGALLPINWGLATINIYTQVGLITLIGLISKHGILMVDFAKNLRVANPNLSPSQVIIQSAATRLRPVLMTTAAMILGVFPLLLAVGAGAKSRFDIGLVIASGMLIGTFFTLFIVPVMYVVRSSTILLLLLSVVGVILMFLGFSHIVHVVI